MQENTTTTTTADQAPQCDKCEVAPATTPYGFLALCDECLACIEAAKAQS